MTVLIGFWFLIPGFVRLNVQVKLFVRDKLWSLQMLYRVCLQECILVSDIRNTRHKKNH